ncbi:MAG TPA: prepilin-type N-terminal cleavage/methylation domain-containing protein [Sporichthya sp.]|nr:prepilin-type N-terminal cleavage/methylation domain-containing protein [Sporichthya sp.]
MAAVPERAAASAHPAGRRSRDAGFSLVEIIVALSVFAVLAVACATMAINSLHTAGDNRDRVRAANLASAEIERTRAAFRVAKGSVSEVTAMSYPVVDGLNYTVKRRATWLDTAGHDANSGGVSYTAATGSSLRVEVFVSWPTMGGRPPVINTTVLS